MRTFLLLVVPDLAALSPLLDSSSPPQAAKSSAPAASAASAAVIRVRPFTSVLPSGVAPGAVVRAARSRADGVSSSGDNLHIRHSRSRRGRSRRVWGIMWTMEAVVLCGVQGSGKTTLY